MLGTLFVVLICAFCAFSVVYLAMNDFASETTDVVFPAIGAILFSSYLAVKTVWIDAPAPATFNGSIALLESKSGAFYGVPDEMAEFAQMREPMRGAQIINQTGVLPIFENLQLSKKIAAARVGDGGDPLGSIIEYSILSWLSLPDMAPGVNWRHDPTGIMVGGGGGGGGKDNDKLTVTAAAMPQNELVARNPVTLELPRNSSVETLRGSPPSFVIRTRYSTLEVTAFSTTYEDVRIPARTEFERKLHRAITPDVADLVGTTLSVHAVTLTFRQSPFTRFAKQAKVEAEWFKYIQKQFERDFSWEEYRRAVVAR